MGDLVVQADMRSWLQEWVGRIDCKSTRVIYLLSDNDAVLSHVLPPHHDTSYRTSSFSSNPPLYAALPLPQLLPHHAILLRFSTDSETSSLTIVNSHVSFNASLASFLTLLHHHLPPHIGIRLLLPSSYSDIANPDLHSISQTLALLTSQRPFLTLHPACDILIDIIHWIPHHDLHPLPSLFHDFCHHLLSYTIPAFRFCDVESVTDTYRYVSVFVNVCMRLRLVTVIERDVVFIHSHRVHAFLESVNFEGPFVDLVMNLHRYVEEMEEVEEQVPVMGKNAGLVGQIREYVLWWRASQEYKRHQETMKEEERRKEEEEEEEVLQFSASQEYDQVEKMAKENGHDVVLEFVLDCDDELFGSVNKWLCFAIVGGVTYNFDGCFETLSEARDATCRRLIHLFDSSFSDDFTTIEKVQDEPLSVTRILSSSKHKTLLEKLAFNNLTKPMYSISFNPIKTSLHFGTIVSATPSNLSLSSLYEAAFQLFPDTSSNSSHPSTDIDHPNIHPSVLPPLSACSTPKVPPKPSKPASSLLNEFAQKYRTPSLPIIQFHTFLSPPDTHASSTSQIQTPPNSTLTPTTPTTPELTNSTMTKVSTAPTVPTQSQYTVSVSLDGRTFSSGHVYERGFKKADAKDDEVGRTLSLFIWPVLMVYYGLRE